MYGADYYENRAMDKMDEAIFAIYAAAGAVECVDRGGKDSDIRNKLVELAGMLSGTKCEFRTRPWRTFNEEDAE